MDSSSTKSHLFRNYRSEEAGQVTEPKIFSVEVPSSKAVRFVFPTIPCASIFGFDGGPRPQALRERRSHRAPFQVAPAIAGHYRDDDQVGDQRRNQPDRGRRDQRQRSRAGADCPALRAMGAAQSPLRSREHRAARHCHRFDQRARLAELRPARSGDDRLPRYPCLRKAPWAAGGCSSLCLP